MPLSSISSSCSSSKGGNNRKSSVCVVWCMHWWYLVGWFGLLWCFSLRLWGLCAMIWLLMQLMNWKCDLNLASLLNWCRSVPHPTLLVFPFPHFLPLTPTRALSQLHTTILQTALSIHCLIVAAPLIVFWVPLWLGFIGLLSFLLLFFSALFCLGLKRHHNAILSCIGS